MPMAANSMESTKDAPTVTSSSPARVILAVCEVSRPAASGRASAAAGRGGRASGAGMERATDCDIRIASTDAYFGLFEVKRGIMANYAINNLARVLPYGEASYLMLTGDTLSVDDAYRLGFVREILAPEDLMPRAVEIAEMIGANAPLAVEGTKAVGQFWRRYGLEESLRFTAKVGDRVLGSQDALEGPKAFAEKRPPVWRSE